MKLTNNLAYAMQFSLLNTPQILLYLSVINTGKYKNFVQYTQ